MDPIKCGTLIRSLRTDAGLTQRELAQQLCVTDKAVSKWERGLGCPDVSLLSSLSAIFRVDLESLLNGSLPERRTEGGNMKRTRFAMCPVCGNVITASANAQISCCGRTMELILPPKAAPDHLPSLEKMDGEYCLTFPHEMTKAHFIRFVSLITFDRMTLVRLYPEQDALVRLPYVRMGTVVFGCSQHGLMCCDVKDILKK